jgi:hypothetical protein
MLSIFNVLLYILLIRLLLYVIDSYKDYESYKVRTKISDIYKLQEMLRILITNKNFYNMLFAVCDPMTVIGLIRTCVNETYNKCCESKYFNISCVILIQNFMKYGVVSLLCNLNFLAECTVSSERSNITKRELNWTCRFRVNAIDKFLWRKRR